MSLTTRQKQTSFQREQIIRDERFVRVVPTINRPDYNKEGLPGEN